jgi:HAE1 family hydrophobic/amphiphilic exporter-1
LTLYITPVVYLYLDKVDLLLRRRLEPPDDLGEDQEFEHRPQAVAAE